MNYKEDIFGVIMRARAQNYQDGQDPQVALEHAAASKIVRDVAQVEKSIIVRDTKRRIYKISRLRVTSDNLPGSYEFVKIERYPRVFGK